MRSTAAKVLKADKPAPAMRERRDQDTEVTKADKPTSQTHNKPKPVKKAGTSSSRASATAPKLGLKVSAGLNMGTLYPLKKRRNVIGRRVDAAFPVQDERASRDHASIEFKKGHFMLTDLQSTNGTFLNNKAVTSSIFIKEGDQIRIGSSVFVVEALSDKNPEMVEKWASMTTIVPRTQVLEKAKQDLNRPVASPAINAPRWKHLTKALTEGHQKHLHQARFFGIALGILVVAAAILTSL
jgi:pSer/pThr/pTyr-binding forkhead associated (FHA) protein